MKVPAHSIENRELYSCIYLKKDEQMPARPSPSKALFLFLSIGLCIFILSCGGGVSFNFGPAAFSFPNQTDVAINTTITSDTVTLGGTFSNVTATCNEGCVAISHNGGTFTSDPVTGFNSGDTIAIQILSSSNWGTAVTASVSVDTVTSSIWSVTTSTNDCDSSAPIGTICADGTVYAGLSPDGNVPMYTTPCDFAQTWDGSTCTGTATWLKWCYNLTILTGVSSSVTGESNTETLYGLNANADGPYEAATTCYTLSRHGHTDWYLPARGELNLLYVNRVSIGGFDTSGNYYWAATESTSSGAYAIEFAAGTQTAGDKWNSRVVRCVRKD